MLKVGAAISMTYITGQPIVFVGTGQTYTDLKSLNAKSVVAALMKWKYWLLFDTHYIYKTWSTYIWTLQLFFYVIWW